MKPPHPNDVIVGSNIRIFRMKADISQTELGEHLGVTFQQVQKYEKGTNRVGAGRLLTIANFLNVPIPAFYDGTKGAKASASAPAPIHLLEKRDAFKLAEAFSKIESQRTRNSLVALVQSLVEKD
jgi:transcriptional regulator with XRE-family HTH domain